MRYETPVTSLTDLFDDMMKGSLFSRWGRELENIQFPHVDIVEEKDAYKIMADLPGMDKKDIKIEVDNGILTISGEKKSEKTEREKNRYYHFERTYGSFSRAFKLPENSDAEHIEAKFNNGVLEMLLKKTEVTKPKAIEVKVE
jgi:HSP20 family protein